MHSHAGQGIAYFDEMVTVAEIEMRRRGVDLANASCCRFVRWTQIPAWLGSTTPPRVETSRIAPARTAPARPLLCPASRRNDTDRWGVSVLSPATRAWLSSGRHVVVDKKRIFVRETGDPRSPALLLIHGFPTSSYDWRQVGTLLAGDFRCVSLDLPGYGLSDKPVAYSYSLFQQADVVEGVLDICGVRAAHLISHDVGTSVHTELLARQEESTLSFDVLTSTFLNGSILKGMAALTEFQRILETPSLAERAQEMCDAMLPGYVSGLERLMAGPQVVTDEDAEVMTELLAFQDGPDVVADAVRSFAVGRQTGT